MKAHIYRRYGYWILHTQYSDIPFVSIREIQAYARKLGVI
jgi:hypothetical protein